MSKEQIEKMAKCICMNCAKDNPCSLAKLGWVCNSARENATALYNAGFREQSEGEWEIVKGSNGKEKMVCTNCRHQQDLASTFTYCPNCGAKMKGV
jgi:hypothetical protein